MVGMDTIIIDLMINVRARVSQTPDNILHTVFPRVVAELVDNISNKGICPLVVMPVCPIFVDGR